MSTISRRTGSRVGQFTTHGNRSDGDTDDDHGFVRLLYVVYTNFVCATCYSSIAGGRLSIGNRWIVTNLTRRLTRRLPMARPPRRLIQMAGQRPPEISPIWVSGAVTRG